MVLIVKQVLLYIHRTFLKNCPFMMKIRTSQDGQKLFVKEISGDHNHELSEVLILFCICMVANTNWVNHTHIDLMRKVPLYAS